MLPVILLLKIYISPRRTDGSKLWPHLNPPTATDHPFPSSDTNQSRLAGRPRPSRGDLRGKAVQPWRSTKTRSRSPTPSSRWTVSLPPPVSSLPTDLPTSIAPLFCVLVLHRALFQSKYLRKSHRSTGRARSATPWSVL
jgi:hypothetical protein